MAKSRRRPPARQPAPPQVQQTTLQAQSWSGPLPPPAALQAFEDICPGAAEQIVAEFRAEAAHRRELERQRGDLVVRETHIGQALAGTFALSAMAVVAYSAYVGAQWIGSIVGGTMILGVVVAFLRGRKES